MCAVLLCCLLYSASTDATALSIVLSMLAHAAATVRQEAYANLVSMWQVSFVGRPGVFVPLSSWLVLVLKMWVCYEEKKVVLF